MAYQGGCHCGAVTFTVVGDPPVEAISCNCSHCRRKGFLLAFVSGDLVTVSGAERLVDYTFNRHMIAHRFCDTCGCQPLGAGRDRDGNEMASINLRCVPSIDLDALAIQHVDGASF